VYASSLILGQGDDEFAAEVGDVGDHAAPDRVERGERRRDTSPTISWAAWKGPYPSAGVGAGMGRQMATGSGVASTAFEWVHASWDNAGGELLRPPRPRRRGDGATGGVASARSVEWRSVTYAA
jgi:hypothetical protein